MYVNLDIHVGRVQCDVYFCVWRSMCYVLYSQRNWILDIEFAAAIRLEDDTKKKI